MITLVVSNCPVRLRGYLTRWLCEIHSGVYVGKVSKRVRLEIWGLVKSELRNGQAVMTYPDPSSEQGFAIETIHTQWEIIDLDGMMVVRRPITTDAAKMKAGWSKASRMRKSRRRKR